MIKPKPEIVHENQVRCTAQIRFMTASAREFFPVWGGKNNAFFGDDNVNKLGGGNIKGRIPGARVRGCVTPAVKTQDLFFMAIFDHDLIPVIGG